MNHRAEFVSSSVFVAVPNNVSCPATTFLFFRGIVYYKQLHVDLRTYKYTRMHQCMRMRSSMRDRACRL